MDDQREQDRLTSRLKRYATMTGAMGETMVRAAAHKVSGKPLDHDLQAKALTKALGRLKGPVMKIAQMLSTIPDAIPQEYVLEFQSLQADAPAMGWPFVRRRMAAELGSQWQDCFQSFEHHATSAASLGQVHKAISKDGQELACKLQYPEMASTVQADLNQLRLALKIYEAILGGVRTEQVYQEIAERLFEELDYGQEAENLRTYGFIFKNNPAVHVPAVMDDLSTPRLLTMTWLEGTRLKDVLDTPQDYRNRMAELAFYAWYHPFFHHGIIHGDPHLGNYTFQQQDLHGKEGINLFDFGCVRRFEPTFIQAVKNLYQALNEKDEAREIHAFESLGFKDLSREMIQV